MASSNSNPWRLPLLGLLAMVAGALITARVYKHEPPPPQTEAERIAARKSREVRQPAAPMGDRVCIISVDGLRPDLALRADAPGIRALIKAGAFSFWAETTDAAVTLPSHSSMITGVVPDKHGVTWNAAVSPIVYPKFPTLMDVARKNRPQLTSAVVAAKLKFNTFCPPESVDWSWLPPSEAANASNQRVAEEAVRIITDHAPNILFIHFGDVDQIGHFDPKNYPREMYGDDYGGWGSPAQLDAIHTADEGIRRICEALQAKNILRDTLMIVSADHGGQGTGHGKDDVRSRHIPWIVNGPRVRAGYDLTRIGGLVINTEDTFATASYFLGLPIDPAIDGRPVLDVFETNPSAP